MLYPGTAVFSGLCIMDRRTDIRLCVSKLGLAPEGGERDLSREEPQRVELRVAAPQTPGFSSHDGLVRQSVQNQAEGSGM